MRLKRKLCEIDIATPKLKTQKKKGTSAPSSFCRKAKMAFL